MSYIDNLINYCHQAKAAKDHPSETIVLHKGDSLDLIQFESGIYIFELVGGEIQKVYDDFVRFKNQNKDLSEIKRSCPKVNKPSKVLYVGSSTTGLRKRIEQHQGKGPRKTYALHLDFWFEGEYKLTILKYDVSKEVLQIIEDDLSTQLKPAFGKLGGNNK
jgi:Uri superfamily endonuclease